MPKSQKTRTPTEKAAQRRRTKANKIKKLTLMLAKNPDNQKAKERLSYWKNQI